MEDRFKFRIWDSLENGYRKFPEYNYIGGTFNLFSTDEKIVEQWTGLYDKNNKPIYEGDIVKDIEGYIGQVKFCDGTARFIIEIAEDISDFSRDMPHELKIIGNIHENADLLGEE